MDWLLQYIDPVALAALIGFATVMLLIVAWPLGFDEEE